MCIESLTIHVLTLENGNWAVVVSQLAKRSLPTPEEVNPDIGKVFIEYCLLSTVLKRRNKEKRPGVANFCLKNRWRMRCEKIGWEVTFVVVFSIWAILFQVDITSGPEPSRLAPTLPLHVVIGLALAVGVAVAGAALQGTVLSIPTWQEKCTNITNMVPIGTNGTNMY